MSKVDELREKYPKVSKVHFNNFVAGDTTPTKKYLEYMCIIWTKKMYNLIPVVGTKLVKSVLEFDSLLPYISNKDIYSLDYRDYSYLVKVIDEAKITKADKNFDRKTHIDILIENDDYLLLRPKTFEGSLKYGANTRWCTASKHQQSYFNTHSKGHSLIYLINKKLPIKNNYQKVAFLLKNNDPICNEITIWNQIDKSCNSESLMANGWDFKVLYEIIVTIRVFAQKSVMLDDARTAVEKILGFMKTLDLDTLQDNLNILKNHDNTFVNESKEIVEVFNKKMVEYLEFLK